MGESMKDPPPEGMMDSDMSASSRSGFIPTTITYDTSAAAATTTALSASSIASSIGGDPMMNHGKDHPSMWAISYKQLLKLEKIGVSRFGLAAYKTKNMHHMVEEVIIPVCKNSGTGYSLAMNPNGLKAEAFITHCWDEPFSDFVESIKTAFHAFTAKPNLWICAFALLQGNKKVMAEQLDVPLDQSPFVLALEQAQWFVVVRNTQTDLYSRIWCVCELIFATKFGFTTTVDEDSHSSDDESNNGKELIRNKDKRNTMVIGPDKFSASRSSCRDAQSTNPADKKKILKVLQEEHDIGYVDKLVMQYRQYGSHPATKPIPASLLSPKVLVAGIAIALPLLASLLSTTSIGNAGKAVRNILLPPKPFNRSFVPGYSLQTIELNSSSPQALALSWIRNHPDFEDLPDWRKQQLFALVTFFHSTGGNKEYQMDIMAKEFYMMNECSWPKFSIDCNSQQRPELLSAWYVAAGSTIPPEVSLLSSLTKIDVSQRYKNLTGPLPTQLGLLKRLTSLSMYTNSLNGSVPSELALLSDLETIQLGGHPRGRRYGELSGSLPSQLASMAKLRFLDLEYNRISGTIPTWLFSLRFQLRGNAVGGTIPSEIGVSSETYEIDLSGNELSGELPSQVGLLTDLYTLQMQNNSLSGHLPSEIAMLKRLEKIDLSNNRFVGRLHRSFPFLTDIRDLRLDNNNFTGSLRTEIGLLSNLGRLGFFPGFNLCALSLRNNSLTGTLPSQLCMLKDSPMIDLSQNSFNGSIQTTIGLLSRLEMLDLHSNLLTATIPSELGLLPELTVLSLFDNFLTGLLPPQLANASGMSFLSLSNNPLGGSLPTVLGLLTNMMWLELHNTRLFGSLPSELFQMTQLFFLSLANNNFDGQLPTELGLLTYLGRWKYFPEREYRSKIIRLEAMDFDETSNANIPHGVSQYLQQNASSRASLRLSNNSFGGTIPTELSMLTKLDGLYLNDNPYLTGQVPSEFSALTALQELTLYSTSLTGPIPLGLCDLPNLTALEVDCDRQMCLCPQCICH